MPTKKTTIPYRTYKRFRSEGFSPKEAKQKARLFRLVYEKKRETGFSPADSKKQVQQLLNKLLVIQLAKQRERVGTQRARAFLDELFTVGRIHDSLLAKLKSLGFKGNISTTEASVLNQALLNELGENSVLAQKWKDTSPAIFDSVLDAYANVRMQAFKTKAGKRLPQTTASPKTVIVCLLRALKKIFPDYSPEPSERQRLVTNLKGTNLGSLRAEEFYGFLRRIQSDLTKAGIRRVPLEYQQHALRLWLESELDSFSQQRFRNDILNDLKARFLDFSRLPNSVQQRRIEESPVAGKIVARLVQKKRTHLGVLRMMRELRGTTAQTEFEVHPEELLFKMLSIRNNQRFVHKQLVRYVLPDFFEKK